MAEKQEITVEAKLRHGRGKNDSRRVRAAGNVPLTIYGGEGGPVSAVAELKDLAKILRSESGHNTVFTLNIDGAGSGEVMFYDRQIDPIRGRLVHADLKRLVFGQKIEVTVPLHLTGEPYGVREEGGMLEQILREVDIMVSPKDIPESVDVDVTEMKVHDVLHVSDIVPGENIEIVSTPETVIATLNVLRAEVEPAAETEGSAEPEVVGKEEES